MPKYEVSFPNGKTYEVESPTRMTDEQAYNAVMNHLSGTPQPPAGRGGVLPSFTEALVTGITDIPAGIADLYGALGIIEKPEESLAYKFSKGAEQVTQNILGINPEAEPTTAETGAQALGSVASFFIPYLGAAKAAKGAGFAAKGARIAGNVASGVQAGALGAEQQAESIRAQEAQGKVVPGANKSAAIVAGSLIGLTDLIPLEKYLGPLEAVLSKVPLAKAGETAELLQKSLPGIIKSATVEGAQEGVSQLAQNIVEKGLYNPDLDLTEGLLGNTAAGGFAGGTIGAILELTAGRKIANFNRKQTQLFKSQQEEARAKAPQQIRGEAISGINEIRAAAPAGEIKITSDTDENGVSDFVVRDAANRPIARFSSVEAATIAARQYEQESGGLAKLTAPTLAEASKNPVAQPTAEEKKEGKKLAKVLKKEGALNPAPVQAPASPEAQAATVQSVVNAAAQTPATPAEAATLANPSSPAKPIMPKGRKRIAPVAAQEAVAAPPVSTTAAEIPPPVTPVSRDMEFGTADERAAIRREIAPQAETFRDMTPEQQAAYAAELDRRYPGRTYSVPPVETPAAPQAIPVAQTPSVRPSEAPPAAVPQAPAPTQVAPTERPLAALFVPNTATTEGIKKLEAFKNVRAKVADELNRRLAPIAGKGVRVNLVDAVLALDAQGRLRVGEGAVDSAGDIISLSYNIYDPNLSVEEHVDKLFDVMNHEVIHSLVNMGKLNQQEMRTLFEAAQRTKYGKNSFTYFDRAYAMYRDIPNYTPEMILEEAVAEMFRDARAGRLDLTGKPKGIFQSVVEFFRRLFSSYDKAGMAKIFKDIESGKVGARTPTQADTKADPKAFADSKRKFAIAPEDEPIVKSMERAVKSLNGVVNCQLAVQTASGVSNLASLPRVGSAEVGDIIKIGVSHYAIKLSGDKVVDVEGWGKPIAIRSIDELGVPAEVIYGEDPEGYVEKLRPPAGSYTRAVEGGVRKLSAVPQDISKEADKAFKKLAGDQRGAPELLMVEAQNALRGYESGPALTYAMEHVGDLTHRMGQYGNEYPSYEFGIEFVAPKVRTGLSVVTNRVDAERIAKLPDDPTLKKYADAHAKLKVYNEAQRAARDAAVALGRKDLKEAERNLLILQEMIDNGTYVEIAGSYDPNYEDTRLLGIRPRSKSRAEGGVRKFSIPAQLTGESEKEFARWWGEGKHTLETADGTPVPVYTGTSKDKIFESFQEKDRGIWVTTSPEGASEYALQNDSMGTRFEGWDVIRTNTASRVIPLFTRIKNPLDLSTREKHDAFFAENGIRYQDGATGYQKAQAQAARIAKSLGHDAIEWGPGIYAIFSAKDLKSTFNRFEPGAAESKKFSIPARLTGESEEEFRRWWKRSKAVDFNGNPLVYYNGRSRPLRNGQFNRGASGALPGEEGPYYFSPDAPFASDYATFNLSKGGDRKETKTGTMYPVFLSVQNPWDYQSSRNVDDVIDHVAGQISRGEVTLNEISNSLVNPVANLDLYRLGLFIERGDWEAIETPAVQRAIRDLGFDGFYLVEEGVRNLAVYKPEQIKSIFNQFEPGTAESRKLSITPEDFKNSEWGRIFAGPENEKILNEAQNPKSRTTIVAMSPDDFIAAATYGLRNKGQERVYAENVGRGMTLRRVPYLAIATNKDGTLRVVSHDGRHRALALKELGAELIPVQIEHKTYRWGDVENPPLPDTMTGQAPLQKIVNTPDSIFFPRKDGAEKGRQLMAQPAFGSRVSVGLAPDQEVLKKSGEAFTLNRLRKYGETWFKENEPTIMRNLDEYMKSDIHGLNVQFSKEIADVAMQAGASRAYASNAVGVFGNEAAEPSSAFEAIMPAEKEMDVANATLIKTFELAKTHNQRSAFVSRLLPNSEQNASYARPGLTLFFYPVGSNRTRRTEQEIREIISSLPRSEFLGGFTAFESEVIEFGDGRGEFQGIRFVWIPEYAGVDVKGLADNWESVVEALNEIAVYAENTNIGSAKIEHYDVAIGYEDTYDGQIAAAQQLRAERNVGGSGAQGPWRRPVSESVASRLGISESELAGYRDRGDLERGRRKFSIAAQETGLNEQEFARWFKKSDAVNPDGTPMVYYRGDPRPLKGGELRTLITSGGLKGEEGPFFFSPSPKFAENFAIQDLSRMGMGRESLQGVMTPVYLSVQKPWDYRNPSDVESLLNYIYDSISSGKFPDYTNGKGTFDNLFLGGLENGSWKKIEKPFVQRAIRDLGYDGFYVVEGGTRNLAIYQPSQAKSIFNRFEPGAAESRKLSVPARLTGESEQEFARWFGDSKVVDKDGAPLLLYRGLTIPAEGQEKGIDTLEPRKGEAGFASPNPYLASSYAREDGGSVTPFYIKAQKLIEFPSRGDGRFDMFEFDARAKRLKPGEVMVVRNVRDAGPAANLLLDPEFKANERSDVYAFGNGTSVKSALNEFAPGTADSRKFSVAPEIKTAEGIAQNIARTGEATQAEVDIANQSVEQAVRKISVVPKEVPMPPGMDAADEKIFATAYIPSSPGVRIMEIFGGFGSAAGRTGLMDRFRVEFVQQEGQIEKYERAELIKDIAKRWRAGVAEYSAIAALDQHKRHTHLTLASLYSGAIKVMALDKNMRAVPASDPSADPDSLYLDVSDDPDNALFKVMEMVMTGGPNGDSLFKQFRAYAIAQVSKRRISEGKKVPSNVTAQYIAEADNFGVQYPIIAEAFTRYQTFNTQMIQAAADAGAIPQNLVNELTDDQNYFSMYRELGEGAEVPVAGGGVAKIPRFKEYRGSVEGNVMADPFEAIVHNVMFWTNLTSRTIASRKAYELGKRMGIVRQLKTYTDPNTGNLVKEQPDPAKGEDPRVLNTRVNGNDVRFATTDPLFATGLMSTDYSSLSNALKFLGMPADVLRESVTRDPGFMIANLLRDSVSTWSIGTSGANPAATFKGLFSAASRSDTFKRMYRFGTIGSFAEAQKSPRQIVQSMKKKIIPTDDLLSLTGAVKAGWDKLELASEASDAATRIAVYEDAIKNGATEFTAAYRALSIMNFSRSGHSALVRGLSRVIPFLNARIQGFDVLYRGLKTGVMTATGQEQLETERTQGTRVLYRAAGLAAASLLLHAMQSDDDEYKNIPRYIKDSNTIVGIGGGKFIAIPKPFEAGFLFMTVPTTMYDVVTGDRSSRSAMKLFVQQFGSTFGFNPFPQFAAPIIENYINVDLFTGQPLISPGIEKLDPSLQYNASTSYVARGLSELSKYTPFGYSFESGRFEGISPIKIDNLITGYGGPIGSYISMALGGLTYAFGSDNQGLPVPASKLPVIRRFFIDAQDLQPQAAADAYELYQVVDSATRTMARLRKSRDFEAMREFRAENIDLLRAGPKVRRMTENLSNIRAQMRRLEADKTMSYDQKLEKMRELRAREARVTRSIADLNRQLGR